VYVQHSIKKYKVQYEDTTTKVRRLMTILLPSQVVAGMTLPLFSFFFLFLFSLFPLTLCIAEGRL